MVNSFDSYYNVGRDLQVHSQSTGTGLVTGMLNTVVIDANSMVNAYSPARLNRDQVKRLLGWERPAPSQHVTDAMLVVAVENRLHMGRLTLEDVAAA